MGMKVNNHRQIIAESVVASQPGVLDDEMSSNSEIFVVYQAV